MVWLFVAPRIDWDNSLSTKWIFAGNTHTRMIINPYAAKVLVFLKKSRIPNEISAIPDRYTNSKW